MQEQMSHAGQEVHREGMCILPYSRGASGPGLSSRSTWFGQEPLTPQVRRA